MSTDGTKTAEQLAAEEAAKQAALEAEQYVKANIDRYITFLQIQELQPLEVDDEQDAFMKDMQSKGVPADLEGALDKKKKIEEAEQEITVVPVVEGAKGDLKENPKQQALNKACKDFAEANKEDFPGLTIKDNPDGTISLDFKDDAQADEYWSKFAASDQGKEFNFDVHKETNGQIGEKKGEARNGAYKKVEPAPPQENADSDATEDKEAGPDNAPPNAKGM